MNGPLSRFRITLSLSCMLLVLHVCVTMAAPPPSAPPDKLAHASGRSNPSKQPVHPQPESNGSPAGSTKRTLTVTATAYTSHLSQTNSDPYLAAWGDRLKPGMRCIAVSRDLLKMGLTRNSPVRIKGLPGVYLVKDKLHRRWTKRIDIYHGLNVQAAKQWGKRKVVLEWIEASAELKAAPIPAIRCILSFQSTDRPPPYPFHGALQ
jgi:3D (Asp-Asp-Asp) domain-containing protein